MKIELPPDLRQRILTAKANVERATLAASQARAAADAEIAALESVAAELAARIAVLSREAVNSDAAAGELVQVDRRLAAIHPQLAELKKAREALPGVSKAELDSIFSAVLAHWQEAIKDAILQAVRPFGYPDHLVLPLLAHSSAVQSLQLLSNNRWRFSGYGIGDLCQMLDSALAGNIFLTDPPPAESPL